MAFSCKTSLNSYCSSLADPESSWQNVITGAKNSTPEDPHGGILADDMGLGKTLSTLAVVVGSLGRALDFAIARTRTDPQHWHNIVPSKTTLVVVPSSCELLFSIRINAHSYLNSIAGQLDRRD